MGQLHRWVTRQWLRVQVPRGARIGPISAHFSPAEDEHLRSTGCDPLEFFVLTFDFAQRIIPIPRTGRTNQRHHKLIANTSLADFE
jgi:hypothetical protein